jgi:hypothetical protein
VFFTGLARTGFLQIELGRDYLPQNCPCQNSDVCTIRKFLGSTPLAHRASLFYLNNPIHRKIMEDINLTAGPSHLEGIHFFRCSQTEVNAQVVLRYKAASASHLVDL